MSDSLIEITDDVEKIIYCRLCLQSFRTRTATEGRPLDEIFPRMFNINDVMKNTFTIKLYPAEVDQLSVATQLYKNLDFESFFLNTKIPIEKRIVEFIERETEFWKTKGLPAIWDTK